MWACNSLRLLSLFVRLIHLQFIICWWCSVIITSSPAILSYSVPIYSPDQSWQMQAGCTNLSVTALCKPVLNMYSYRCLCKSLNGIALLIKFCITALLYENFYCCQKAVDCLAGKRLCTHTVFSILSCLQDSKTIRYRRNKFSFFQRSSLHRIVLIILFNPIFCYHFLPSTTTFCWLVEGICPFAGGRQSSWGYWAHQRPWAELLCKGDNSGSWPLNVVCCLRGWIFWDGDLSEQRFTVQGEIADGNVWVRSRWRLPGASGGGSLLFIVMLFCVYFSSFLFILWANIEKKHIWKLLKLITYPMIQFLSYWH